MEHFSEAAQMVNKFSCSEQAFERIDGLINPFMFSSTAEVSAVNNGRDFIGIDHSQKYCDTAEKRLAVLRNS